MNSGCAVPAGLLAEFTTTSLIQSKLNIKLTIIHPSTLEMHILFRQYEILNDMNARSELHIVPEVGMALNCPKIVLDQLKGCVMQFMKLLRESDSNQILGCLNKLENVFD